MKRLSYKGKTVILTGASSGIGLEIARELILKHGAIVYAIARGRERLKTAEKELASGYVPVPMDAGDKGAWESLYERLKSEGKTVDVLINCAGILPEFKSYEKTEEKELLSAMNINVNSQLYSSKIMLPIINKGGAIINVSSAAALCPFGGISLYALTKSASCAFTQALGCELDGISASAVLPGFVKTDIMKNQEATDKESRLISFFSASPKSCVRKILRRARRRRGKIVVGLDARLMSALYTLFPSRAPKIITRFLKISGLKLCSKI